MVLQTNQVVSNLQAAGIAQAKSNKQLTFGRNNQQQEGFNAKGAAVATLGGTTIGALVPAGMMGVPKFNTPPLLESALKSLDSLGLSDQVVKNLKEEEFSVGEEKIKGAGDALDKARTNARTAIVSFMNETKVSKAFSPLATDSKFTPEAAKELNAIYDRIMTGYSDKKAITSAEIRTNLGNEIIKEVNREGSELGKLIREAAPEHPLRQAFKVAEGEKKAISLADNVLDLVDDKGKQLSDDAAKVFTEAVDKTQSQLKELVEKIAPDLGKAPSVKRIFIGAAATGAAALALYAGFKAFDNE